MNSNSKKWVALVVIAIIAIGGAYLFPKVNQEKVKQQVDAEVLAQAQSILAQFNNSLGAVPTLDGVDNPNVSIGGRQYISRRIEMNATTSVLCSLSPGSLGTSTAQFSFTLATSSIATNVFYGLSTSTSAVGSSTNNWMKGTLPIASFGLGPFQARLAWNTSTSSGTTGFGSTGDSTLWYGMDGASSTVTYLVAPNQYLNLRLGTSTPGTFSQMPKGYCNYLFEKV